MSINTKKPAMKQTVGAQYMCFADATEGDEYNGTYEADVEKTEVVKSVKVTENSQTSDAYASGKIYDSDSPMSSIDIGPMGIVAIIGLIILLYNKCEWFRNGVNAIFGGIADFIKGVINKIKGFFNFEWKLPKIKLPHFKASGEWSLVPPKVPKFSVDWYANGGILNSPTIFGLNGNSLMGGGEAGKEAVLPIDLLRSYIREENQRNNEVLAQMIAEAMSRIPLAVENNIQLGDKKLADVLVDAIIKKMSQSVKWKKGAVGA